MHQTWLRLVISRKALFTETESCLELFIDARRHFWIKWNGLRAGFIATVTLKEETRTLCNIHEPISTHSIRGISLNDAENQKCMLLHEFNFPALYLRLGRSHLVIRFSGETWTIKLASQVQIASSTGKALKCKVYSPILLHFRDHKRDRCTWSDYEGRELKCISHIARSGKKSLSSLVNCEVLRLVAWASSFWRRKSSSGRTALVRSKRK